MTDLIHAATPETLRDMAQALGFRATVAVDASGAKSLQSATNGMAFEVRLGNAAPDGEDGAVDLRFVAAIRVEGELDLALVNAWNNSRRFGRLRLDGEALILDFDVSVAGGVAPAHLAAQFEIWNRLVEALIEFLRAPAKPAERAAPARTAAAPRAASA